MKSIKVYAYDPVSGELVAEYPSVRNAEKANNLYRGAITDTLRSGKKSPCGGFVWSMEKRGAVKGNTNGKKINGGVPIENFRAANDISAKVNDVLTNLPPDRLFSIDEIIDATGLRRGFSGLRTEIDSHREHYGKGVADGTLYFGHPETIAELKSQKTMI